MDIQYRDIIELGIGVIAVVAIVVLLFAGFDLPLPLFWENGG